MDRLRHPAFWSTLDLAPQKYFVLTLHRPANVDHAESFAALIAEISKATRGEKVIFPVHPRTAKTLRAIGPLPENTITVDAQPYLELNFLVKHARGVITDSGGITKETTVMGVPCITLRSTTERPETVTIGTDEVIGSDPSALKSALDRIFSGRWKKGGIPDLWDGHGRRANRRSPYANSSFGDTTSGGMISAWFRQIDSRSH